MRVVEAGARAFFSDDPEAFDSLAPAVQDVMRDDAAAALDAMLDCLAENAEEIDEQALDLWRGRMGNLPFDGPLIAEYLTALRTTEGE